MKTIEPEPGWAKKSTKGPGHLSRTIPPHERDTVRIKFSHRPSKPKDMIITTTSTEGTLFVHSVEGQVLLDKITDYLQQNMKSAIEKRIIWDFSRADFSGVSVAEIRTFLIRMLPLSYMKQGSKEALVSTQDEPFDMMTMFKVMAELDHIGLTFRCFRTVEDAKNWLLE